MSEASKWTPPPTGSPCWIDIPAADVLACKNFYAKLFPSWEWRPATAEHPEEKIAMFQFSGGGALSGGITSVSAECKADDLKNGLGVTIYHMVDSIEETKERVEELGGKTVSEKIPETKSGWYMHFKDVAGNRFGAYEMRQGTACS